MCKMLNIAGEEVVKKNYSKINKLTLLGKKIRCWEYVRNSVTYENTDFIFLFIL